MNSANYPSIREMIRRANKDPDAASCFVSGSNFEDGCDGMVIIVKGAKNAFKARNLLANHGLLEINNGIPK